MRGESGPPLAPTKSGPSVRQVVRAKRNIVCDQVQHLLQHRHHAGLVALAGHGEAIALAGRRHVLALEAERLGNAKARAIEQRHNRGVTRENPGLALLARAQIDVGDAFRRGTASGFGRVLAIFGARTAFSAPTLPLPLRSRNRANERTPASWRISVRAPMPTERRCAMKARTSCGWSAQSCKRGRPPRCRRKVRNWGTSRAIGLDGFGRHSSLGRRGTPTSAPARRASRADKGTYVSALFWHDCLISPLSFTLP